MLIWPPIDQLHERKHSAQMNENVAKSPEYVLYHDPHDSWSWVMIHDSIIPFEHVSHPINSIFQMYFVYDMIYNYHGIYICTSNIYIYQWQQH